MQSIMDKQKHIEMESPQRSDMEVKERDHGAGHGHGMDRTLSLSSAVLHDSDQLPRSESRNCRLDDNLRLTTQP